MNGTGSYLSGWIIPSSDNLIFYHITLGSLLYPDIPQSPVMIKVRLRKNSVHPLACNYLESFRLFPFLRDLHSKVRQYFKYILTNSYFIDANSENGNLLFQVQEGGTHKGDYVSQYIYNGLCRFWNEN